MSEINCPQCRKDDAVQKVTAIVQGETHTTKGYSTSHDYSNISGSQKVYSSTGNYGGCGELSGGVSTTSSTRIDATQRSTLAQQLLPPSPPSEPVKPITSDLSGKVGGLFLLGVIPGIYLWTSSPSRR